MMKKVIIIDDNITQLNLMKVAFAKNSWDVCGAQNVKSAYELIYDNAPDLIVTDAIIPFIGGFQFIKTIRENQFLSKIPIIVYSTLDRKNAKYYTKEQRGEYFLQKNNNLDELLDLSNRVIKKHELSKEYKLQILKAKMPALNTEGKFIKEIDEDIFLSNEKNTEESIVFDCEELALKFKEKYNFIYSDEKNFAEIFEILYPILKYNLAVFSVYSYEKRAKMLYMDIKYIILSPIFQNQILNRFNTGEYFVYKTYAPNLKTVVSLDEFPSCLEFDFEYNNKKIASVAFYSKEKNKWNDIQNIDDLRQIINNYFIARYINKSVYSASQNNKGNNYFSNKFSIPLFNKPDLMMNKNNMYFAILDILNFSVYEENLSQEELDFLCSKISEKTIELLDSNEQIYRNNKDEYSIVIYAKDEKQAQNKLDNILEGLKMLNADETSLQIAIGASNCTIDNIFNFSQAQKNAISALEESIKEEKAVIKNAK